MPAKIRNPSTHMDEGNKIQCRIESGSFFLGTIIPLLSFRALMARIITILIIVVAVVVGVFALKVDVIENGSKDANP